MVGKTRSDLVFNAINILLIAIITLIVIYPLYFIAIASVSSPRSVNLGQVVLWPKEFTAMGYTFIFERQELWQGYLITIILALSGTAINLVMTFTGAYALSKTYLPGIRPIMFLFTFTMFFGGGLIPTYILISDLGLRDTLWAILLPSAVSAYNLILAHTYMLNSIPGEIIDSAEIDGCGDFRCFISIVVPLSLPIIATIALFSMVGYWNSYFEALIYITDSSQQPLQLVLRKILLIGESMSSFASNGLMTAEQEAFFQEMKKQTESLKYGVIIVSSLPMLILYPFLQKYFMRGILAGSLKG